MTSKTKTALALAALVSLPSLALADELTRSGDALYYRVYVEPVLQASRERGATASPVLYVPSEAPKAASRETRFGSGPYQVALLAGGAATAPLPFDEDFARREMFRVSFAR